MLSSGDLFDRYGFGAWMMRTQDRLHTGWTVRHTICSIAVFFNDQGPQEMLSVDMRSGLDVTLQFRGTSMERFAHAFF